MISRTAAHLSAVRRRPLRAMISRTAAHLRTATLGAPRRAMCRTFAAATTDVADGSAASSSETTTRDGSKDKPDEEWEAMVEAGELTPQSYLVLRRKATEPGHAVRVAGNTYNSVRSPQHQRLSQSLTAELIGADV